MIFTILVNWIFHVTVLSGVQSDDIDLLNYHLIDSGNISFLVRLGHQPFVSCPALLSVLSEASFGPDMQSCCISERFALDDLYYMLVNGWDIRAFLGVHPLLACNPLYSFGICV